MPKSEIDKKPLKVSIQLQREPILNRKDSLHKVIKVIDSRSGKRSQPSTSRCNESLPKDQLILNAETLLILNLLGMSSDERETFLIETAKQRKLLLTNPKTNTFNVNPDLFAVKNVPQVVDFVHQFHGKPMPVSVLEKKKKTKERWRNRDKQMAEKGDEHDSPNKIIAISNVNVQGPSSECGSISNISRMVIAPQKPLKSKQVASIEKINITNSLKVSAQSASTSHLNNLIDRPNKKPRTLSASDSMAVCRLLRHGDTVNRHRQDVDEAISKRQQKRLRKQLKAMCIESTVQANEEKAPRKRGSRGSKKGAEGPKTPAPQHSAQPSKVTLSTTSKFQTDVAAKNLIRNKCSQINVKIQEKLDLCSNSAKQRPSTSLNETEDIVIESIKSVDKSDDDNDEYSSVSSDSSNFPNDEETTSYFARSDEMESSCNEKRAGPSKKTYSSGPVERSILKDANVVSSNLCTYYLEGSMNCLFTFVLFLKGFFA